MKVIPFFVVDRPISLKIINCFFSKHYYRNWGILTHAFTSKNFKEKFKQFPQNSPCDFFHNFRFKRNIQQIYKIVDSGIFIRDKKISYEELFEQYEDLNADFGVIIDFLKDKDKTLQSAEKAIKFYQKNRFSFKLIAVAQGNSKEDYLACFKALMDLGFEHIALGGLLKRNGNSSFVTVSSDKFLEDLLREIREKFNPKWLFTFGVFHHNRVPLLEKYKVWGADYKGWLFQYDTTYSNLLSILEKEFKIFLENEDRKKIIQILNTIRNSNTRKDKLKLKKKLNFILNGYGLSLQQIRIIQLLNNLEKQLKLSRSSSPTPLLSF